MHGFHLLLHLYQFGFLLLNYASAFSENFWLEVKLVQFSQVSQLLCLSLSELEILAILQETQMLGRGGDQQTSAVVYRRGRPTEIV